MGTPAWAQARALLGWTAGFWLGLLSASRVVEEGAKLTSEAVWEADGPWRGILVSIQTRRAGGELLFPAPSGNGAGAGCCELGTAGVSQPQWVLSQSGAR